MTSITVNMQWLYSNAIGGVKVQVPSRFAEEPKPSWLKIILNFWMRNLEKRRSPVPNAVAQTLSRLLTEGDQLLLSFCWSGFLFSFTVMDSGVNRAGISFKHSYPREATRKSAAYLPARSLEALAWQVMVLPGAVRPKRVAAPPTAIQ